MAHVLSGIPLKELTGVNIFEGSLERGFPGDQGPKRQLSRLPPSNRNVQVDLVRTLGSHTSGKPADRDVYGIGVVPPKLVPSTGAGHASVRG